MSCLPFTTNAAELTARAAAALLAQQPVRMVLPTGWERPKNFPLPIAAHKDTLQREYRPLSVLEWVNDELAAAAASEARKASQKEAE